MQQVQNNEEEQPEWLRHKVKGQPTVQRQVLQAASILPLSISTGRIQDHADGQTHSSHWKATGDKH